MVREVQGVQYPAELIEGRVGQYSHTDFVVVLQQRWNDELKEGKEPGIVIVIVLNQKALDWWSVDGMRKPGLQSFDTPAVVSRILEHFPLLE